MEVRCALTWKEFESSLIGERYFRLLDKQPVSAQAREERRCAMKWLELFRKEEVWKWARDSWIASAVRNDDDDCLPVLKTQLRAHLLDLRTRLDLSQLEEFWTWVIRLSGGIDHCADIWRAVGARMGATLTDARTIVEQEQAYCELLMECAEQIGEPRLRWARMVIEQVAQSRTVPSIPSRTSCVQIACVWERRMPGSDLLRPGVLIRVELHPRESANSRWLLDDDLIEKSLRDALERIPRVIGQARCYAVALARNDISWQLVTGTSAALPIMVGQLLASVTSDNTQAVLQPWMCITGGINSDGTPEPVANIGEKLHLLQTEGVRSLLTPGALRAAADMGPLKVEPTTPRRPDLPTLQFVPGGLTAFIDILRQQHLIWPAQLPPPVPHSEIRRQLRWPLALALLAFIAAMTLLVRDRIASRPFTSIPSHSLDGPAQREAAAAPENDDMLQRWAFPLLRQIQRANVDGTYSVDPHDFYNHEGVKSVPELPAINAEGYVILEDHRCFDLRQWVPIDDKDLLKRLPIEPAVFTRRLKIRKIRRNGSEVFVRLQLRTGGFQAWWRKDRDSDLLLTSKRLEGLHDNDVDIVELVVDISNQGNDGQPFWVTARAVIWNGWQDQQLKHKPDWAAVRTDVGCQRASLLVLLPTDKICLSAEGYRCRTNESAPVTDNVSAKDGFDNTRGMIFRIFNWPEPGYSYHVQWKWKNRTSEASTAR